MVSSLRLLVPGCALVVALAGCGDDTTDPGTGGGGGSGGGSSTITTTSTTTTSTTTSTTTTTSTGPDATCEDAAPSPTDVVIRNDSSERIFLADFPDYSGVDLGWFDIDESEAGCPCLKPAFCSTGSSNESGPSIGYLDPGSEMTVPWQGLIFAEAEASCGHTEGCVLDVAPAAGPLTFRVTGYRTAECATVEGCECDLATGEPCYTGIDAPGTVEDPIEVTASVTAPVEGPVSIVFTDPT